MTLVIESEIKTGEIIPKDDSNKTLLKSRKRPEWQLRSPIKDVFFRYGEYFS